MIDTTLLLILAGIFGMIMGSFATALIYRLPRDENWITKRSNCTICKINLTARDLIPIFSYIFSGGKCRHCKTKFSPTYLYYELLMTASFMLIAFHFGATAQTIILCLLAFLIIILSIIDFEHYIIPDEINIGIFALGLFSALYYDADLQQIILMPLVYLAIALALRWGMFIWKKKEGLGLGDVKFFFAAGIFLSFEILPMFLFLSGIIGILIAIIWRLLKKGDIFPFGPALSISLFLCVAFPDFLIDMVNKLNHLMLN